MHQNTLTKNKLFATSLFILLGIFSCKPLQVIHTTTNEIDISPENIEQGDAAIKKMVEPYKLQLDDAMEITVAILKEDLIKEQPESTLGNHVAEITYWSASKDSDQPLDFALSNYGGLRVPSVNKGPLKVKDAYQIMPFDNYVVIMKVPGSTILELVNKMASNGGWPVYNMSYEINNDQAVNIKIQDQPLNIDKEYTFALTDYLANGGDKLSFLKEFTYHNTNVYLRDAIINFWKDKTSRSEIIEVVKDGRVKIME